MQKDHLPVILAKNLIPIWNIILSLEPNPSVQGSATTN